MILSFDEFELDTDRFELRRDGEPRKVEPKVFDLIAHLVANPGQVFSRDDLIAAVWRGRIVSDATVSTCVKSARKALGESGNVQRYIRTVRGRGFLFAGDVASDGDRGAQAISSVVAAREIGAGPSLLMLPFRALSDDAAVARLAKGLRSDLAVVLNRIPLLRLGSQADRYVESDIAPSAREIHEELGVDFVLEGNLQGIDGGVRLNAQLCDARSGFQLWAGQFSFPGPIDAARDDAVNAVIAKLEPQLHRAIYDMVRATGGEPNSRELFLEASSILALKGWHPESFLAAAQLLRRSCRLAPDFALAHAYLALVMGLGRRIGLVDDPKQAKAEALAAAERALELDSMDSSVLGFAGCSFVDTGDVDRALPILRNAVEINPANAQAWAALGSGCLLTLRVDEAIEHLTHGIRISPLDSRLAIWGAMLALALMMSNDLDGAAFQGELACQRDHRNYIPRVVLAGIRLLRDEPGLAIKALNDAYRIKPDLVDAQVFPLLGQALGRAVLELG